MWPDRRLLDLFGIEVPIVQAPMAGFSGVAVVAGVSAAGGLGSLPGTLLDPAALRAETAAIRARTNAAFNVNFFCHAPARVDAGREAVWRERLAGYYRELGLPPEAPSVNTAPFGEAACAAVEELRPAVVSFHFGLPEAGLVGRVKAAGCRVMSSATTVAEARWLEEHGCDAVIAQGVEAGGHRGMFLSEDLATQTGTMALVPQVVDAVSVPVIAAGGIADGRGIAAALALGAAGVQIGTAYLFTPEATVSALHKAALRQAGERPTALTNVFTGRPARGLVNRAMREVGPISDAVPDFPTAGGAIAPLKAKAEAAGADDFTSLWSGQAAALGRELGSRELTQALAEDALRRLAGLSQA
jgi:nitronate monooxygenase